MTKQTKIKRIKHVSDLPTWFKLEKYSETKNLDANGWCEQLYHWASCLMYFDSDEGSARRQVSQDADFLEALSAIREKPIYDMKVDGKLSLFFYF
jgi:hypothetical protein